VDVGGQVGEREGDALVLDDRLAERLPGDRVVACELERGARDADRLGRDHRASPLEGAQRRRAAALHGGRGPALLGRCRRRRSARRPSPPRGWPAGTRQSSKTSSPVSEARQPSLSSLRNIVRPGVPFGTTKTPWPRWPAWGSTVATTTWTSAIPPLPTSTWSS